MSSLYDLSVPIYIRSLQQLSHILKKAEQWADENKVPHEQLTEAKLIDDMLPLKFQIYSASNTSKAILPRLGGMENVSMEDDQNTFAELQDRIAKTISALQTIKPESFAGKENSKVVIKPGNTEYTFTGLSYLQIFGMPNFFFHVTAAYSILRAKGVPVGKMDYLGGL